ncbi:MAG: AAA family ATPase [Deltaproteobacteria bacterium]|nr:AAA family ATPase [Deltaproteobacteria bacterium]
MYCDFYQMSERPFNVTPDPKCLYLNARYREALAALQYGISQRKGFITLIGEAGTGKTTLLKRLLDEFDQKTRSVFIFNTHVSFEEILEYIFAEFDLPVHNGKKLYMLQRLNTFLLEELRGGGNVALLIDEAQDLDFAVLEDLRLLSNLETAKEKILQIVLSGQPELGEKLNNPNLRQLRQRIAVSCRLQPLSREELGEYVQYRLHAVGCSDLKLFSRDAEDQLYHFSHGIPRLINVVCDNALVIGYALGKKRIGGDVISEAAADLMPLQEVREIVVPKDVPPAPVVAAGVPLPSRARIGLIAMVLVAIAVGLLSVGRSMLQRPDGGEPAAGSAERGAAVARPPEVIRPGSRAAEPVVEPAPPEAAGRGVVRPLEVPAPAPAQEAPADSPFSDAGAASAPVSQVAAQRFERVAPSADEPPPAAAANKAGEPEQLASVDAVPHPEPMVSEPIASEAPPLANGRERARAADEPRPQRAAERAAVASAPSATTLWDAEAAPVPAPVPAPVALPPEEGEAGVMRLATNQMERVIVQPGDSVSRIALKKYGQANYTILDLLKLANPNLRDVNVIAVGQALQLPDLSESSVVSAGDRRFGVLVYSTTEAARAAALDAALRARGQRSRVSRAELGAGRPIFRVVIEGFAERNAAAAASKEVQRLFREDSRMALLVR